MSQSVSSAADFQAQVKSLVAQAEWDAKVSKSSMAAILRAEADVLEDRR